MACAFTAAAMLLDRPRDLVDGYGEESRKERSTDLDPTGRAVRIVLTASSSK